MGKLKLQKCVLIVDDNVDVRRKVCEIVSGHGGWQVCGEAGDGREAVEKASQLRPDLVILDLSMPVMNGLDAAREIHKILPSVRLLLFTAFHTQQIEEMARSAGISAYIPKTDVQTLLSHLDRFAFAAQSSS